MILQKKYSILSLQDLQTDVRMSAGWTAKNAQKHGKIKQRYLRWHYRCPRTGDGYFMWRSDHVTA